MASQLIPPPELMSTVPDEWTIEQRIALWADLMDACEQFLLAGLRREVGPAGDVEVAYRRWYAQEMEEHDRVMRRMVEEFNRRWEAYAK